jgi:NTP pyrophosphatase (non-canonical NTP hydrolase)
MDFREYQQRAMVTAIYPEGARIIYPALGLANEAGEVLGKIKKVIRDRGGDFGDPEVAAAIGAELGDVLWYVAALCRDLGLEMDALARQNVAKLAGRAARGALQGEGDAR